MADEDPDDDGAEALQDAIAQLKEQTRELSEDDPGAPTDPRRKRRVTQSRSGSQATVTGDPFRDRDRRPLPQKAEEERGGGGPSKEDGPGQSLADAMSQYQEIADEEDETGDDPDPESEPERDAAADEDPTRKRVVRLGVAVVVVLLFSPLTPSMLPVQPVAVASDAMAPQLPKRSLAVAVDGTEIVEQDLIAYETPEGVTEIRRVVAVQDGSEEATYTVTADADGHTDELRVSSRDVVGEVHYHVPLAGFVWLLPKTLVGLVIVTGLGAYAAIVAIEAAGGDEIEEDDIREAEAS